MQPFKSINLIHLVKIYRQSMSFCPTLPHPSPHVEGTPAIGTLGESPTRPAAVTQGSQHRLAFLKTTAQYNTLCIILIYKNKK